MPEASLACSHDPVLEKRVLRKLDLGVLLPITFALASWTGPILDMQGLDVSVVGLIQDTHLHGNQFNNVLVVYVATNAVSTMPSTTFLRILKPNRVIGFLAAAWGIVTTLAGLLVKNYVGLIIVRLFLGAFDGALLPAVIFYMSCIYKRYELQSRVGLFFAGSSMSAIFGGLVAAAISNMNGLGGLAGWRWIFIIEGVCLALVGVAVALIMPRDAISGWFLTPEEREHAACRLEQDAPTKSGNEGHSDSHKSGLSLETTEEPEEFEWREFRRGIFNVQTWLTGLASFLIVSTLVAISYFMPAIIVGLGYSAVQAQVHTVPAYVLAVVLTVVIGVIGDRLKLRGPLILCLLPVSMMGYIILIAGKTAQVQYAGAFFVAAGSTGSIPCLWTLIANNSHGYYKRAAATAFQMTLGNLSGILGSYIYTADQEPRYIRGHVVSLTIVVGAWILVAANVLYCMWENKARREGQRDGNIEEYRALRDAGKTKAPIGDRHPSFMFAL